LQNRVSANFGLLTKSYSSKSETN